MERMHADPHVERILPTGLGDIFVRANTGGFEGFAGELLVLVGNEMAAEGEVVDGGAFAAEIEYADLGGG